MFAPCFKLPDQQKVLYSKAWGLIETCGFRALRAADGGIAYAAYPYPHCADDGGLQMGVCVVEWKKWNFGHDVRAF